MIKNSYFSYAFHLEKSTDRSSSRIVSVTDLPFDKKKKTEFLKIKLRKSTNNSNNNNLKKEKKKQQQQPFILI